METLEKLSEKCNQKPLFEFEMFTVRPFDPWNLYIERNGEGCCVSKLEFMATLNRLFNKNFD